MSTSIHFNSNPTETKIQSCGNLGGRSTTDPTKVTCKRCLKRISISTAFTGKLA